MNKLSLNLQSNQVTFNLKHNKPLTWRSILRDRMVKRQPEKQLIDIGEGQEGNLAMV